MVSLKQETPDKLKPYVFHGIDLTWKDGEREALGDCVFCGRENKFSVNQQTGQWHCFVCHERGNVYNFLTQLFTLAKGSPFEELAQERGLVTSDVLRSWRLIKSPLVNLWCIPGFNEQQKLTQVYQYQNIASGKKFVPTPTLGHAMHGLNLYDKNQKIVYLCEGPFDAIALWEVLRAAKDKSNVLAVPGCGTFKPKWASLFAKHEVKILFDNDHPHKNLKTRKMTEPAGYAGALRTAQILSDARRCPESIEVLTWGDSGYNPSYKSGYDIRDALRTFEE